MTVLVTGATGRVGSRLVRRLRGQSDHVRMLVRDRAKAEPLVELGAEVVVGNVTDAAVVSEAVKSVDSVVHLVTIYRSLPGEDIVEVNHLATVELARAALRAGVNRFVYCSTNQVYGPGRSRPAVETDEPEPDRPYSITKTAAERSLLELYETEGLPLRIFRPPVIYGDGDPRLGLQPRWSRKWPLHRRLQLVHHADVVQALLLGLAAEGIDGQIFNAGDDAPISAYEILRLNGIAPDADAGDRPLADPWQDIIDSTKIRRMLGFRPIYPSVYSAMDAGAL
jgi:nucleoside-diphosphate-sugar epimerase